MRIENQKNFESALPGRGRSNYFPQQEVFGSENLSSKIDPMFKLDVKGFVEERGHGKKVRWPEYTFA